MNDVDVIVPTQRRPEHLARALRSLFAQNRGEALVARLVVVDNSPEASAQAVVEALRPACPVTLLFVHEPRPGVATARNAGLAACDAPYVAFLDDDEEATPEWLGRLYDAHLSLGAAVTFGPIQGVATGARPAFRPYLDRFFSREGPGETRLIEEPFGCGNSMMTRAVALAHTPPFDARSDRTGGEDDRLFSLLREEGCRFGWAVDAQVYEHAPPHRVRVRYALKRAFCYGQGPSKNRVRAKDWPGLALTMGIGCGQASVYGLVALLLLMAGRANAAAEFMDRAVRGGGKVFWPLRLEFYGLATAPSPPGPDASAPRLAVG